MVIKVFVIAWLLLLRAIEITSSGLCQQQAQSAFQLISLGNADSKEDCYNHCCKRKECHLSILSHRRCFGISCPHKNLCKAITEQLIKFEGHRVDKRSLSDDDNDHDDDDDDDYDDDANNRFQYNTNVSSLKGFSGVADVKEKVYSSIDTNDDLITTATSSQKKLIPITGNEEGLSTIFTNNREKRYSFSDNNDKGSTNITDVREKRHSVDDDNDDEGDNKNDSNKHDESESSGNNVDIMIDNEKKLQCAKSQFQHSTIPKRKKSYLFQPLHGKFTKLSDCSQKCCKTEDCVLAFTIEKSCYAVICSDDSNNCHSKKDKLPSLKILLALISPKKGKIISRRSRKKVSKAKNIQRVKVHLDEERHSLNGEYIGNLDDTGGLKASHEFDTNNALSSQEAENDKHNHDFSPKKEVPQHFDELSDDIRMLKYAKGNMDTLQVDDDKMGNYNSQYENPIPTVFPKQQQEMYVPLPDHLHNLGFFNKHRADPEDFIKNEERPVYDDDLHLSLNNENESAQEFLQKPTSNLATFKQRHQYVDHGKGDHHDLKFEHSTVPHLKHYSTKHIISKFSTTSKLSVKKPKYTEKNIDEEGSTDDMSLKKYKKKKVKSAEKDIGKEDLILSKIATLEAKLAEKLAEKPNNNTASVIQSKPIDNEKTEKEKKGHKKNFKRRKHESKTVHKSEASGDSEHLEKLEKHQIKKLSPHKKGNAKKSILLKESHADKTEKEGSAEIETKKEGFEFNKVKSEEKEHGSGSGIEEDNKFIVENKSVYSKQNNAVKGTKKEVVGINKQLFKNKSKGKTKKITSKKIDQIHQSSKTDNKNESLVDSKNKLQMFKDQKLNSLSKVIHEDDDEEGSTVQKLESKFKKVTSKKPSIKHDLSKTSKGTHDSSQIIKNSKTFNESNGKFIDKNTDPKSITYENTKKPQITPNILDSTNSSQSSKRHHIPHKKNKVLHEKKPNTIQSNLVQPNFTSIHDGGINKKNVHKKNDVFKKFEKLRELYEKGVDMKAHRKELKMLEAELIGSGDAGSGEPEGTLSTKVKKKKRKKKEKKKSPSVISTVAPTTSTTSTTAATTASTTATTTTATTTTTTTTTAATTTATRAATTIALIKSSTTNFITAKNITLLHTTHKANDSPFKINKLERKNLHAKAQPTQPVRKKTKPTHKSKPKISVTQFSRTVPTVSVDPENLTSDWLVLQPNHTLNKTKDNHNESEDFHVATSTLKVPTLNIAIGDEPEGPVLFSPTKKPAPKKKENKGALVPKVLGIIKSHKADHLSIIKVSKKIIRPTKQPVKIKEKIQKLTDKNKNFAKPSIKHPIFENVHLIHKPTIKFQKDVLKLQIPKTTHKPMKKTTPKKPTVHVKPFPPKALEKKLLKSTPAPSLEKYFSTTLYKPPTKAPVTKHYEFFLPTQRSDLIMHHPKSAQTNPFNFNNNYFNPKELGNPLINVFKNLQEQSDVINQEPINNNKKLGGNSFSSLRIMDDEMPNEIGTPKLDNPIVIPKPPPPLKKTNAFKLLPFGGHVLLNNPTKPLKQQMLPIQKNVKKFQNVFLKKLEDKFKTNPEHFSHGNNSLIVHRLMENHHEIGHIPTLPVKYATTKGKFKPLLAHKPTIKPMSHNHDSILLHMSSVKPNKKVLSFPQQQKPQNFGNLKSEIHNQKEKLNFPSTAVNDHINPISLKINKVNNTGLHKPTEKKKESPIEIISRLLGGVNKKDHKGSALDDFFSEHKSEPNPLSSIHKSTDGQSLKKSHNKLESFFKKTEIKEKPPYAPKNQSTTSKHKVYPKTSSEEKKSIKNCNILKDLKNTVFSNEHVGSTQEVPGVSNMSSCAEKCCHLDTCHVAMLEVGVCKLVHCSNHELCHSLTATKRNVHLVFLDKNVSELEPMRYCAKQNSIGVPWEPTLAGSLALRSCPRDAFGQAKRQCDIHAHWQVPDFSECTSLEYSNMEQKMNGLGYTESARSLVKEMEDVTTQSIDNSMIFGGDLMRATKTITGIVKFITETKAESFDHSDLKSFTKSISNMLDETNKQEWMNIQQIPGPSRLMNSLDNIGLYSAERMAAPVTMKPVITRSVLLSVVKRLPSHIGYSFPNYTIADIRAWSNRRDSITIPPQAFAKDKETLIASANFKTLGLLLPHRWNTKKHVTFTDGFVVNSNVISCSVIPKPNLIQPPVLITLHHLKEFPGGESKCVFWDFRNDAGGSWSTEGCSLVSSNRTLSICSCNHLTHFAVLTHTGDQKVSAKEQAKEHSMAAIWLGIPLGILLIVASFYTCFTWSKAPRRRHVVIMDKKPTLPEDEEVVTQRVSEKFPGSPDRYLYAANVTPSPSELEWEHAWDFLTNSDFNGSKKILQEHLKKECIRQKIAWKEKESDSITTVDSQGSCFQWKHQDDFEWSKERIKCLGKGLLNVSSEHLQCSISSTSNYDEQPSFEHITSHLDTFSPIAISSPQSISFEELLGVKSTTPRVRCNYLQISFDADEGMKTPDIFRSLVSLKDDLFDSIEETAKSPETFDCEMSFCYSDEIDETSIPSNDMLLNIPPMYSQLPPKKCDKRITPEIVITPKADIVPDAHIFNVPASSEEKGLVCKDDCCVMFLDKLFEYDEDVWEDVCFDEDSVCVSNNGSDQFSITPMHQPSNAIPYSIMRKMYSRIHAPKSVQFRSIGISSLKKSQKEMAKDAKQTLVRTQTMHMKSYIALRQQCRMNEVTKIECLQPVKRSTRQSKVIKKLSNIIKESRTSSVDSDAFDSVVPSRPINRKRKSFIVSLKEQYPIVFKSSLTSPKYGKLGLDNFQSEVRTPPTKLRSPLHRRKALRRVHCSKNTLDVKKESIKQPKVEDKLLLERRAFSGHLSRWDCEEHLP